MAILSITFTVQRGFRCRRLISQHHGNGKHQEDDTSCNLEGHEGDTHRRQQQLSGYTEEDQDEECEYDPKDSGAAFLLTAQINGGCKKKRKM
jgi:hypothetical protein